jgi:potassium channel subfamily K, other eukaryote
MNDPGLDEPMKEAAEDLERDPYEHDQNQEEEEEQNFLDPRHALPTIYFCGSNCN